MYTYMYAWLRSQGQEWEGEGMERPGEGGRVLIVTKVFRYSSNGALKGAWLVVQQTAAVAGQSSTDGAWGSAPG